MKGFCCSGYLLSTYVVIDIDEDGTLDVQEFFSPGDSVVITYGQHLVVYKYSLKDPDNPPNQIIIFEGKADSVKKNGIEVGGSTTASPSPSTSPSPIPAISPHQRWVQVLRLQVLRKIKKPLHQSLTPLRSFQQKR